DNDDDDDNDDQYNSIDYARLTDRQRARLLDQVSTDLQELPEDNSRKKVFTADELALRRTETARRRKNLSEKRREEEKRDTINRLLKKQAPKRKTKSSVTTSP
ncbi:hypothetical protein V1514DRAFT_260427, partial [Lipomyces japonicus]|uniref:uncharacterized protein n=1 Tax=Lipomyces japonicus TaxID=56871 RepID=UPI0034CE7108